MGNKTCEEFAKDDSDSKSFFEYKRIFIKNKRKSEK